MSWCARRTGGAGLPPQPAIVGTGMATAQPPRHPSVVEPGCRAPVWSDRRRRVREHRGSSGLAAQPCAPIVSGVNGDGRMPLWCGHDVGRWAYRPLGATPGMWDRAGGGAGTMVARTSSTTLRQERVPVACAIQPQWRRNDSRCCVDNLIAKEPQAYARRGIANDIWWKASSPSSSRSVGSSLGLTSLLRAILASSSSRAS